MHELIQPGEWIAIKFPSEQVRILQILPNTTVALGKYGAFPANLLVGRPFHLTYEVQDRRDGEDFSRLRVVPAIEVHADMLAEGSSTVDDDNDGDDEALPTPADDNVLPDDTAASTAQADISSILTAADPVAAIAQKTGVRVQTMTLDEIETLKREGATDAGRELVARLLSSHTALDRKTAFARAKYRLLKVKKYLRRFTVLPLHVATLAHWFLREREAVKIMDMREEMLGLLGCWANVHFAEMPVGRRILDGEDVEMKVEEGELDHPTQDAQDPTQDAQDPTQDPIGGRWLVIDDTGGLLVASVAERMGILHPYPAEEEEEGNVPADKPVDSEVDTQAVERMQLDQKEEPQEPQEHTEPPISQQQQQEEQPPLTEQPQQTQPESTEQPQQTPTKSDTPPWHYQRNNTHNMALTNTITVLHTNAQPSLHVLKYYNFDVSSPPTRPPFHPLTNHLLPLSWLQLLDPGSDPIYSAKPAPPGSDSELATWKASRKSTYFRKLRRWNRLSHIINSARGGGFSGLAVASSMDPASILQHAIPLLAPGAPVAVYAQTLEPLAQLADYFSTARRAAWSLSPPAEAVGRTLEELERWQGTEDFPLNPTLLLGATVQTSRARQWQVLPGRTHPLMTGKGGSDGFVFTAWKAVPAAGKIQARGKYKRRKLDPSSKE